MIVTRLLGDYLSFLYFNRDIELYGKVVNIKKLAGGLSQIQELGFLISIHFTPQKFLQ